MLTFAKSRRTFVIYKQNSETLPPTIMLFITTNMRRNIITTRTVGYMAHSA